MEEELVYCLEGHKMRINSPQYYETCDACAVSSSRDTRYYSCSECHIKIHKKCAEFPKQIDHPMHPEHPLLLSVMPPRMRESEPPYLLIETRRCQVCKNPRRIIGYHCYSCDFDVHIACAFVEDDNLSIMIPTHHHRLRLIPRQATFRCNACDVEQNDDESYVCIEPSCAFWIHKKCGLLPELFKRPDHDHPLQLAVRMPHRYRKYNLACEICQMKFGSSSWIYYCQLCKYFIHIRCRKDMVLPGARGYQYPLSLVMIRDMKTVTEHALPYSMYKEKGDEFTKQEDKRLPEVKVDSHDMHSLVLISDDPGHKDVPEAICDGCIQLIDCVSSPYYKCGQDCNFFLHTTCVSLPRHKEGEHGHDQSVSTKLKLHFPKNPWEVLKCTACKSLCNGYGYKCNLSLCDFYLDIKCSYLLGYVTHIGHKHRLTSDLCSKLSRYKFTCSGCGNAGEEASLNCVDCRFRIGYECATLPAVVTHRWDKHPLILTFPPFFRDSPDADEEFYCEICEDEIHPKRWIYRCTKCDQSFHPSCIPTLGECKNIKFGKTFRIRSHPHPLTSVPQAKLTSKCYYCRKSLNWSRAFECAPCGFYLCPDCIPEEQLEE